jgi:hypothetical protein
VRRSILSVAIITSLMAALVTPASAQEEPISNSLPAFVTGPTDFSVTIAAGNPPICAMTYGTQERTQAPWQFTFDPKERVSMIRVSTCQGSEFNYYLTPPDLAYFISRNAEIRESGFKSKMFVVNNVELPGKIQVLDGSGKVLASAAIGPRTTPLTVTLPKIANRLSELQVVMTSDDGAYTVKDRILVSRGWAQIATPLPIAPCSITYWRYVAAGAPKDAKKVEGDIVKALALISKTSGVAFIKASDQVQILAAKQSLTFGWRSMLGTGGAVGERNVSKGGSGYRTKGQIWMNGLAPGMSDRFAGAAIGRKNATPGRAWPITGAILSVMGMESTQEKGNLMYPVLLGTSGLGAGDRFGINYLFAPSTCEK